MTKVCVSGSGLYAPPDVINNEELVESLNAFARRFNEEHAAEIEAGTVEALKESSSEFIYKASGIKSRHVLDKKGILDIDVMHPVVERRGDDKQSLTCELGVAAAKQALQEANKKPSEIDAVIVSCTNKERPYPNVSIEIQHVLGIDGYAFDMGVACSSATFGIQAALSQVMSKGARSVLMVTPEIATPQIDFSQRDSHFIFGDVATALVVEDVEQCTAPHAYEILSTKLKTQFSNNIRCNFGFLNRLSSGGVQEKDPFFKQNGRKVFKDVVPMVTDLIIEHLNENDIHAEQLARLWLHQANSNMNRLVSAKVLGTEPDAKRAPTVLDEYANTAGAASLIAFHKYHNDLSAGDYGLICSFGAGYSIGSILLQKL